SNTSAIPISILQNYVPHPHRFLGIHWAEPAFMTRFLEITCGEKTDLKLAEWAFNMAHQWGKEPTLLKKDIRGFVTNRLMYAVYREGLSLVDKGDATIEDLDKAFRYDAGSWMTLMGIFRRLDYLGLNDMETILKNIFPQLNNNDGVPLAMQKMIALQAKGTQTAQGFYNYKGNEAKEWEEAFADFNKDIDQLAALYPSKNKSYKDS
ncbi:MAG: 3-hydroxyacyl-CoA dehydrogenase family protein, partial [Sphingobacteriaceae bacterium]